MPVVEMRAQVAGDSPRDVLRRVADFERWPERSEDVKSCVVQRESDVRSTSLWEVSFRRGVMRWSQRDELDLDAGEVRFELIEGDPVAFGGHWRARAGEDGCELLFEADFDLGIDTLSHVLDPLAVEALEQTIESVVRGVVDAGARIEFRDNLDEELADEEETVGI